MKKSLHELSENFSGSQAYDHEFGILLKHNMGGFVDRQVSRQLRELEPKATPPSNNMGGTESNTPLHFPHGEKSAVFCEQKTKIDWFGFTSSADVEAVKMVVSTIWPDVVFSRKSGGMPGYPDAYLITLDSVQYGLLGTGAAHGRHFVSLSGTACKTLTDELVQVFYDALTMTQLVGGVPVSVFDARISRIDLCFDSYRREITYDDALAAYYEGGFKRPKARTNPELKKVSVSSDRNLGRTMYVGKRDGHVMGRIYEKGLEVFAKLPEEMRLMSEEREGDICGPSLHADDWLRLEAEFKRVDKDRPLPLEMMLQRDVYFAGAYPFFAAALGMADGIRPAGLKSDFNVDLLALMHNARRSYGSLIHSLTELGFTADEVVEHLSSGRNNDKLVRSGLLREAKDAFDAVAALDPDFDIPF